MESVRLVAVVEGVLVLVEEVDGLLVDLETGVPIDLARAVLVGLPEDAGAAA